MKIPRYWSRATAAADDRVGRRISISCWRSSDVGQDDAHQSAWQAAQQALSRVLRGERLDRYAYGRLPLREEVLEEVVDAHGAPSLALTRNRYGVIILNTLRVAFLDLDFPDVPLEGRLTRLFAALFGRSARTREAEQEAAIWQRVEAFVARNPDHGFRVYRTRAGVRAIATHDLLDPASPGAQQMFHDLGADPLYVRLCRTQESFRARLTPKPWRCGCPLNPPTWPRESAQQQTRFERWVARYDRARSKYATCRLLGTLGTPRIRPEIDQIIQVHDRMTRCDEPLPLA